MPGPTPSDEPLETLARHLEAIASPTRLRLLSKLRSPRELHEIVVSGSRSRRRESPHRPLSRQAVTDHLDRLLDLGLIMRARGPASPRGDTFVLNHERVFALIDELRALARLRPLVGDDLSVGATMVGGSARGTRLPKGPRLVVVYGRDEGQAYPLDGSPGARWRIGRGPACEVRLDYDPFLSSQNSLVERTPEGIDIVDRLPNRNGTWVNWSRLAPGGRQSLRGGDVLGVGRSLLVFQP